MPHLDRRLVRGLSAFDTTALVVGTVIGTGVFLKAAVMAQQVRTPLLVLAAWVAAGLLSLAGALAYAELGAMLPEAGGEYVYLRESYGEAAAFLFGWQRFVVAGSASIASIGAGFAIFLAAFLPLDDVWVRREVSLLGQSFEWQLGMKQAVAVGAIVLLSAVNCFTVVVGGHVQSALTVLKTGGIAFLVLGILFFGHTADWSHLRAAEGTGAWSGFAAFGTAMLAALWAYDGWNNMPMAAGEVKDPGRNIPRALVFGMLIVMAVYCLANLSYFYALPIGEVVTANSTLHRDALPVASKAAITFLGDAGGKLVAIAFVVSALGALNGSILSNARVPFAMARDGYFVQRLAELSPRTRVPVRVIVVQALWSSLLAVSGSYDQLTDCLLLASWIFYGLTTSAVFVLRRRRPDAARPYRTLGYPFVPALFLLVSGWLVVNTLATRPLESAIGIALIAAGLPIYAWFRFAKRRGEPRPPSADARP
jgi:APA family basic amino acid/polyamine antiporter